MSEREFWTIIIRAALMVLKAIDRRYGIGILYKDISSDRTT